MPCATKSVQDAPILITFPAIGEGTGVERSVSRFNRAFSNEELLDACCMPVCQEAVKKEPATIS